MGCRECNSCEDNQEFFKEENIPQHIIVLQQYESHIIHTFNVKNKIYAKVLIEIEIPKFSSCIVWKNDFWILGGLDRSFNSLHEVWQVNFKGVCLSVSSLLQGRCGMATAICSHQLFAIGGSHHQQTLQTVEVLNLNSLADWRTITPMEKARAFCTAVAGEK